MQGQSGLSTSPVQACKLFSGNLTAGLKGVQNLAVGLVRMGSNNKTVFEVDKLILLPDGWRIGVSCKRTLRERWKQAASLDVQTMDSEKLKSTWHVITYTSDLSVPKIQAIGKSRGIIYIPDNDHFLQTYSGDPAISNFIRPMSSFVSDLKRAISKQI